MKRVLIVIPSFEAGGTNSSLFSLLNAFKEYDITIFPMSRRGGFRDKFACLPLLSKEALMDLWFGNFAEFDRLHKLMALVLKSIKRISIRMGVSLENMLLKRSARKSKFKGYDLVIGYQEGIATEFATMIPAKEHIAWIHCNLHHSNLDFERYDNIYAACDKAVCVSDSGKDAFDNIYPHLASKSQVIYNLIDDLKITQLAGVHDHFLDQIAENEYLFLSVGRFNPIKQFEEIPQIAAALKEYIHEFKWIIIGGDNAAVQKQIEDNIKKHGVADSVLLAGFKTNPYPFFRRANLYVCTSRSEACPMVFLEANTLGTPVVSNDFPSAHELIEDKSAICTLDNMAATIANHLRTNPKPTVVMPQVIFRSYSALKSILSE